MDANGPFLDLHFKLCQLNPIHDSYLMSPIEKLLPFIFNKLKKQAYHNLLDKTRSKSQVYLQLRRSVMFDYLLI